MRIKTVPYILFFIVLIALGCARRGSPVGGPKDETAPIMMVANPPYETLNFKEKEIRIYFDEYVVLKDLSKQLVVSPPLKNPLSVTPQGTASKSITIKILDTLQPNTTYTLNFGNAIQDNNEGNKLENFKYVFATGDILDSLTIQGSVANAYQKKQLKSVSALLYRLDSTYTDSIIFKSKPQYVSSTLDSTNFKFTNVKEGNYRLVVLKETSKDYIYNPITDQIGFLKDTIRLPRDSVLVNNIRVFNEVNPFKFKRAKELYKGKIQFGFQGDRKALKVSLLSDVPNDFKTFYQFEKDKDTLFLWHTPIARDSLNFEILHEEFSDTITVRLRKKKLDSLSITSSVSNVLHLSDTLFIEANNPIVKLDTSKVQFVDKDTVKVSFDLQKVSLRKVALLFAKKPKEKYRLTLLPDALSDVYELKNDTISYRFNTREEEDYGSIILDLKNTIKESLIVELLGKKDKVLRRLFTDTSKIITFDLLEPQTYNIRVIVDNNNNKQWDTGNFLEKVQPERVLYFPGEFKLRANWIQTEVFTIE